MALEDKIRAILEGKTAHKAIADKADKEGNKGGELKSGTYPGSDDETDPDKNIKGEKAASQPVAFKGGKKDKVSVEEESIPGLGAELHQDPEYTSGKEAEAKLVAKQAGTQMKTGPAMEKEAEVSDGGTKDTTAKLETAKIVAKQTHEPMGKLKAEAFEALFSGETLTEEFKTKAEAIFEAAVSQVAEAKVEELQEAYLVQLDEAVEAVKGELVEQIDGYLDFVVEKWMQDNAVALESGIKVEMSSSFMEKMKNVFEEHYIDVPESKVDVVEEQANLISEMEAELADLREVAEKAQAQAQVLQCEAVIAEYQVGLTAIEAGKLHSLAEHIEFETEEEFEAKVKTLKESYFSKGGSIAIKITTQESTPVSTMNESHSDVAAVMRVLQESQLKLIRSSN